ncbi:MAG: hypothetical protein R3192_16805 [Woeseiaceae bacterium]|nr:hypothetical protein [Woeseiaceae bacterium]
MRKSAILNVFAAIIVLPAVSQAQDAHGIMETMLEKQRERWNGVDSYVVDQSVMGHRSQMYFERVAVTSEDGERHELFRPQPPGSASCDDEVQSKMDEMTPEMYEQAAQAYEMTGDAMATEIENGLEQAGLPRGLLAASGSDPWASFDPRVMMGTGAMFMRAAGEAKRQQAIENMQPDTTVPEMREFADRATVVGTAEVDGRKAFHLRADDLNIVQEADGQTFTINAVDSWVDAEMYVPLRMVLTGVATDRDGTRPIEMEKRDLDYRNVPGSDMYESYRQVMRISGMMTPEQQAEMAEAQQQMAEMEQQLAQMPPSQRDMIMRQMGPQMEMMKSMSSGGGFQIETLVHRIVVNECVQPEGGQLGAVAPAAGGTVASKAPQAAAGSDALRAAQQACLEEKMAAAQASAQKKRGFGRLLSAVTRTAVQSGNYDVSRTVGNVYSANATAEDLAAAAKDLGLTEDDVAECQNPQ